MSRHNSIMVSRTLYQIAVVTLVVAVVWIAMGAYQALVKPLQVTVDQSLLAPINPQIDAEMIASLSGRIKFDQNLTPTSTPSPSATSSASATVSASINKGTTK